MEIGIAQARRAWLTKQQVLNTRTWPEVANPAQVSFRQDGQAAVEWAARYLERSATTLCWRRSSPGRCATSSPRRRRSRRAVRRRAPGPGPADRPGDTHWNHPRFFAYFPNTGSEPGILAELLTATLNQDGMLWRTGPALAELEQHVMGWLAQLLGLPATWHGHIEDTASTRR